MFVRSATGAEAPGPGQPLPAPARWHLRTQVSRKTLFDLIQDTLPTGGIPPTGLSGDVGAASGGDADPPAHWPPFMGNGVLPQAYLDPNASTIPMSLNPTALWNDGDTTPDLPEHWRPITITLASTALTPQPQLLAPAPAVSPPYPLHGVARRAGWMLSGVALTFLVSAAAFGGGPLLQAVRSVLAHSQAQAATIVAAHPAAQPAERPVMAAVEAAEVKAPLAAADAPRVTDRQGEPVASSAPKAQGRDAVGDGDRRGAGIPARGARRSRPDRRAARASAPSKADVLPASEDAVMPLEFAAPVARSAPARPALTAIVKTTLPRAFRPIDAEDPFEGR